ncbi:two-component sensor histidine kinase [Paenibacillus sambharensis]|uniref:histidine kinase n=1 Tax=Paenibacillus sambharensis TaxID=1803190 RepID=A0A2W1LRV5_9BACL|nr:sensor histidine kinase [Paenibacillus sambharensis]PZD94561.1 two-component sensor histidine kinase [Paenibacillus sambharensis]
MKPKSKRDYVPFGHKLMITYCVFIIIPVLLAAYMANMIFVESAQENARENYRSMLSQVKDNINYRMDDVANVSSMLYFDTRLALHLRQSKGGYESYASMTEYVLPRIQSTLDAAHNKMHLTVFMHNETLPEIYHAYPGGNALSGMGSVYDFYHIDRLHGKPWYETFPAEQYGATMEWRQVERDAALGQISLLRRLIEPNDPFELKEIGFLRITTRISDLFESLEAGRLAEGSSMMIVDEQGVIVTSSGGTVLQPGQPLDQRSLDDYMVVEENLNRLNWKLIGLLPGDITEAATRQVTGWTILIGLLCYLIFAMAGLYISRSFARKVSKIVAVLDAFREGDFHKRIQFKGRDEFTRISLALNDMGHNIQELIEEVYLSNIRKKEAELESLQAQINPHFLYNTLSSISRLAKFGEVDRLHRMVLDLAKFYRLSLNEGRTVIPIKHELEQIEAYMSIQKTKFGDGMTVWYEIDPDIMGYETIKLILQPFVENVLEHAWYGDRINIRITGAAMEERIVFQVIDDGLGMHPDTLRQLLGPPGNVSIGYGIGNVDQRIKLHYGQQYGVHITSRLGAGTTVEITIPKRVSAGQP